MKNLKASALRVCRFFIALEMALLLLIKPVRLELGVECKTLIVHAGGVAKAANLLFASS